MKESLPLRPDAHHDSSRRITARTIGEAWIAIGAKILAEGDVAVYDGLAIRELIMVTLHVAEARGDDEVIAQLGDPERLAWMHANFTDSARVAALGDADSYATRLYDYEHRGLNQIDWVVERLRTDPSTRSATITTLQPLTDTSYIPCVSLLDFFLSEGRLQLVVYAHSIDFGTKGFANLVELAYLQQHVGERIASDVGAFTMTVKSAHLYERDVAGMNDVLASHAGLVRKS
ncbi:MAG TPA: thymidylate synthase [Acidimicrobiales bacterium]